MTAEVTRLLSAMSAGEPEAAAALLPLIYDELRRLASAQMARLPPGQTLQPTALVHEAYLKLVGASDPRWNGRGHFFGAAAQAMRELIVDQCRRRGAQKRGGGQARIELDETIAIGADGLAGDEVLAVDDALAALEAEHPRCARVVTMRYFAGLTHEEIATALEMTTRTVEREWRFARAWLHQHMTRR